MKECGCTRVKVSCSAGANGARLRVFYSSRDVVKIVISGRPRWVEHVARMDTTDLTEFWLGNLLENINLVD
jgi:hypothetical protein